MRVPGLVLCVAFGALTVACRSAAAAASASGVRAAGGDARVLDARSGEELGLGELAERLAAYDVVFLGEQHDNDVVHRVQAELTEALLARRGALIVSMEMFERDAQGLLDRYLAGEIDEATFLAGARPWPNYAEHYRPAIELAKAHGLTVLAANVPRPLAARVVRAGVASVLSDPFAPRQVVTPTGEYRRRFDALMGGHGGVEGVDPDDVFASQCVKDDAMAESIADVLTREPGTLVVHWCGAFHSDAHLGTVERLAFRRPDLKLAVVTPAVGGDLDAPLSAAERADGDFVLRAPAQAQP